MRRNQKKISVGGLVMVAFILLNAIVLEHGFVFNSNWHKLFYITVPLLLIAAIAFRKNYGKHR